MRRALEELAEFLWPATCAACGTRARDGLCTPCERTLPWITRNSCSLCQERPAARASRCASCFGKRRPLAACSAAVAFEGAPADWIRRFKYVSPWRGAFAVTDRARIALLARRSALCAPPPRPDAIIPVPLHPRRVRARGFNPALIIASDIARAIGAERPRAGLTRLRDTPTQTGLDRNARRRNVAGAFHTSRAIPPNVWLVDDVVTTRATLEAAARALRRAGAVHVTGICLARTPSDALRSSPQ